MRCVFVIGISKFDTKRGRGRNFELPVGHLRRARVHSGSWFRSFELGRSSGTCNVNRNRGSTGPHHAQVIVRRLNYPRPCTTHVVHVCGHANGKDRARRNACFCLLAADLRRNYRTCNRRKVTQVFLRRALPTTSARRSRAVAAYWRSCRCRGGIHSRADPRRCPARTGCNRALTISLASRTCYRSGWVMSYAPL